MSADVAVIDAIESTAERIARRSSTPTGLWGDLVAAGLVATGGLDDTGEDWLEYGCAVLRAAYRVSTTTPLVEAVIARAVFGGDAPAGVPIAVADFDRVQVGAAGAMILPAVPWTDGIRYVVVRRPRTDEWLLIATDACEVQIRENIWRRPAADLTVTAVAPVLERRVPTEYVLAVARIAASSAMAATLVEMLEIAVGHARQREQFGRPLWSFQAIKHQLVVASELVKVVSRAASVTAQAQSTARPTTALLMKATAGSAATTVAQIAHHVHGAIGLTDEYVLGGLSRQLFELRDRFGSEHDCVRLLGQELLALDRGGTPLWPAITAL